MSERSTKDLSKLGFVHSQPTEDKLKQCKTIVEETKIGELQNLVPDSAK